MTLLDHPAPIPVPASVVSTTREADEPEVPEFGPILIRAVAWSTLLMALGTGVPLWWLTGSAWDGIGLGAFCAFWGGPGFGTMAAGAIWTARNERSKADR